MRYLPARVDFNNNCVCTGRVPDPTSLFLPTSFLYVNLVAKGAPKFFKTLALRLTVLDIPYFADAYSRTVRPIDLHNFLRPLPRTQSVMIQLYNTNFPYSSLSPSRTQPGPPRHAVLVHGVQLLVS
jgi:hypothetical protein